MNGEADNLFCKHACIYALGVQRVISQRVQKGYFNLPEEAKPLDRLSIKSNHCFYTARKSAIQLIFISLVRTSTN